MPTYTELQNIDLMRHATIRRPVITPNDSPCGISSLVWDDLPLLQFTPTRLRQNALPRCASITVQISYLYTAVPAGAPWPIVTIRDGSVATNSPLTALNGIEMIPGDLITIEAEEQEIIKGVFLDPTQFWCFLNNLLQVRLHIVYGVIR